VPTARLASAIIGVRLATNTCSGAQSVCCMGRSDLLSSQRVLSTLVPPAHAAESQFSEIQPPREGTLLHRSTFAPRTVVTHLGCVAHRPRRLFWAAPPHAGHVGTTWVYSNTPARPDRPNTDRICSTPPTHAPFLFMCGRLTTLAVCFTFTILYGATHPRVCQLRYGLVWLP
jgi:hypothetical protein